MTRTIKQKRKSKEDKDDLAGKIGIRLKELRKTMGLSMKQLAKETKLSPPLFSRIENGLVMPSVQTLQIISDIFKVDIGYFFRKEEEDRRYVINREGDRKVVYSERGSKGKVTYQVENLAKGMEKPFMEPFIATIMRRNDEDVETVKHGGQELLYVIEGKIRLTLGEKKFVLKKGDAAYFDGDTPHKAISLSKKLAKTLDVMLIPGSRISVFETED
jgi:transcriptional regulator with XRE-family HTH domain